MLELITTYTHAPSCRNWTRIGTQLDSATFAVAQPNGPKLQPVTQTSPWWEDRRLPGECLESSLGVPMTSEARTASIGSKSRQHCLFPVTISPMRGKEAHTGAGRILTGFGGGLSR